MGLATKVTLHTMYCYSYFVLKYRDSVGDRKRTRHGTASSQWLQAEMHSSHSMK